MSSDQSYFSTWKSNFGSWIGGQVTSYLPTIINSLSSPVNDPASSPSDKKYYDLMGSIRNLLLNFQEKLQTPVVSANSRPITKEAIDDRAKEIFKVLKFLNKDQADENAKNEAISIAEKDLEKKTENNFSSETILDIKLREICEKEFPSPQKSCSHFAYLLLSIFNDFPVICDFIPFEIQLKAAKSLTTFLDKQGILPNQEVPLENEALQSGTPVPHADEDRPKKTIVDDPSPSILHTHEPFFPLEKYLNPPAISSNPPINEDEIDDPSPLPNSTKKTLEDDKLMQDFIKVTTWYADGWWLFCLLKKRTSHTITVENNITLRLLALEAKNHEINDHNSFSKAFKKAFPPESLLERAKFFFFYKILLANFVMSYFSEIITKSTNRLRQNFFSKDQENERTILENLLKLTNEKIFDEYITALKKFSCSKNLDLGVKIEIRLIAKRAEEVSKDINKDINKYKLFKDQKNQIIEATKTKLFSFLPSQDTKKTKKRNITKSTEKTLKKTLNTFPIAPWIKKDVLRSFHEIWGKKNITIETLSRPTIEEFEKEFLASINAKLKEKISNKDKKTQAFHHDLDTLRAKKKELLKKQIPNIDLKERWPIIQKNDPIKRVRFQKYFYLKNVMKKNFVEKEITQNYARLMAQYSPPFSFMKIIEENHYLPGWTPKKHTFEWVCKKAITTFTIPMGNMLCSLLDLPFSLPLLNKIPKHFDNSYLKSTEIGMILHSVLSSLLDVLTEMMEAPFCEKENHMFIHNINRSLLESIHKMRKDLAKEQDPSENIPKTFTSLSESDKIRKRVSRLFSKLFDIIRLESIQDQALLKEKLNHPSNLEKIEKELFTKLFTSIFMENLNHLNPNSLKGFLDGLFRVNTEAYEPEIPYTKESDQITTKGYKDFAGTVTSGNLSELDILKLDPKDRQKNRDILYHDVSYYLQQEIDGLLEDINKKIRTGDLLPSYLEPVRPYFTKLCDEWVKPTLTPQIRNDLIQGAIKLFTNPLLTRYGIFMMMQAIDTTKIRTVNQDQESDG